MKAQATLLHDLLFSFPTFEALVRAGFHVVR